MLAEIAEESVARKVVEAVAACAWRIEDKFSRYLSNNIVARINAEVNRVLREPDVAAKLALQGTTAAGGTPEEFRVLIASEIRSWKEVAQKANIKAAE